ncbi:MAG: C25 family cysteine peptidase, partial [Chloroflexota bacterium]|nr:C25 family cysteine peptidase [Anaerolineales bacterium]
WDSGEPFVDIPNGRYDPGESLTSTGQTATTTMIGGKQGIYQFTGLQPGYYAVQVTPPAGSVLTADPNTDGISCIGLTPGGEPSSNLCDNRDGMRLYNGTLYMGADFGYAWSGTFGDRVWIDSNDNGRVDVGERGIPNITVTARTTVPTGATVVVNGTTYTQGQVINLSTTTDADGVYFFQNISTNATITWTVAVDRTDTDFPSGMTNSTDPDDPDHNGSPAHDDTTTITMDSAGVITTVGNLLDADDDGDASDPLYLDADFGYRYEGNTTISGTVCLETTVDGVCGDNATDPNGVGAGETAYRNVTVFLYLLNDTNGNGRFDTGETTSMVSSTLTTASGDFSFSNVKGDSVYYIIAIGAPQNGLDMTSTQATVNSGGDDSSTTSYVETTSVDGSTLSAYQVVHTTVGDTSVVDRDFTFRLDGSYDFGDLPESYSTSLAGSPDGARHLIPTTPNLYFGTSGATQLSLVDADGLPTTDASGDGVDENGVFIYTDAVHGAENADGWTDGVGVIQVDVVGSGWLVGWMDFDGDGSFSDSNEMIINRAISNGQNQDILITTPTTAISSSYVYARFRLFPSQPAVPSLAFSGEASSGEVEDYRFPTGGGVVTPVTLAYFQAQRHGSTVNFAWSTAAESGNIGFNLFVETQDGGSLQINDEFILSQAIDSLTRQDYTYSVNVGGDTFYLQEVSVLGETRLHGPFQLGETYGGLPVEEKIDLDAVQDEHQQKLAARQASAKKSISVPAAARQATTLAPFTVANVQLQNTVNLKVNRTGMYRVTYEMLKAAGLDITGVPVSKITLVKRGQAVPIYLVSQGKGKARGKFGPGDYFEFYGEALDTLYTDTNIYTVQVTRSVAPQIYSNLAVPARSVKAPASFIDTLVVNNQRAYANYAPGADPWYDTSMLTTTRKGWNFTFQLNDLVDASASQSLQLVLWGSNDWPTTDPDHHILVRVNGVFVAEESFDGMVEHTIRANLPAGTLHQGANTLELTLPADTGATFDAITLDRFSVGYARSFRAQDGRLAFTATGKLFTVTNLPSKNVVVYRLDGARITRLEGIKIQQTGSTFSASFAGNGKVATYLVAAAEALYSPVLEAARPAGDLQQPAQYLIIAHPDFIDGLQPLIEARRAQGLTVSIVDVNDVYARYSYGVFDPQAIRQYIAYAQKHLGTQYVLLVGGDTYDYRNYLGRNSLSFIPSLYTATGPTTRFVPVDPLYADVDNNKIPDLAIGRFPVRTSAELDLMVAKTLAYAGKDYGRTAVFASDKFDGTESFKNISQGMSASLPGDWSVQQIHMDDLSVSAAQKQLINALNKGVAFVSYTGHSAQTTWSFSRLFQTQNAEALTNAGRPFVVIQWGCFNTYYVDPLNKTLVQSFLFAGDRGAVAVMGASTRTDSSSEEALGILIMPRLTAQGMTIGQAMQDAKFELAQEHPELLDVILGWTLMGDPALVIQP